MTQEIPVQKKSNMKVIALAVVCIILAASLVGVTAVYVNNQSQITSRDKTIAALNDNITSLELDLSQAPNATIYETQIGYL
jgi:flagellar basal body-associated protein FliL